MTTDRMYHLGDGAFTGNARALHLINAKILQDIRTSQAPRIPLGSSKVVAAIYNLTWGLCPYESKLHLFRIPIGSSCNFLFVPEDRELPSFTTEIVFNGQTFHGVCPGGKMICDVPITTELDGPILIRCQRDSTFLSQAEFFIEMVN
jgi:hypothetical protein